MRLVTAHLSYYYQLIIDRLQNTQSTSADCLRMFISRSLCCFLGIFRFIFSILSLSHSQVVLVFAALRELRQNMN